MENSLKTSIQLNLNLKLHNSESNIFVYVGQCPIFHGPVILPYILKTRPTSNGALIWALLFQLLSYQLLPKGHR